MMGDPKRKSYQVRCERCGVIWPPAGVPATRKSAGLYRNLHAVTHRLDVLGDGLGAAVVEVEVRWDTPPG